MKAGIGVSAENHITSALCAVIGVRGQVVEKLVHDNISVFSGCGLLGTQGNEGCKELVVNCTFVVEESANDALNSFATFRGERRAVGKMG